VILTQLALYSFTNKKIAPPSLNEAAIYLMLLASLNQHKSFRTKHVPLPLNH